MDRWHGIREDFAQELARMFDQLKLDPVHPSEVLAEEFLASKDLNAAALARHIEVSANRVSEIMAGLRAITGDTALRFAAAFGTSEFWMESQMRWELAMAARKGSFIHIPI